MSDQIPILRSRQEMLSRAQSAQSAQALHHQNSELVVVMERCILNGPDHRSLGWCEVGETHEVPAGSYVDFLSEVGLVMRLAEFEDAVAALEASEEAEAEVEPETPPAAAEDTKAPEPEVAQVAPKRGRRGSR